MRMNQRSFLTNNPSVELALLSHPLAQQGKLTFFPSLPVGKPKKIFTRKTIEEKALEKHPKSPRRNKDMQSINSANSYLKTSPTGAILDIRTRWRVSAGRPGQTLPLYNNPRTPP